MPKDSAPIGLTIGNARLLDLIVSYQCVSSDHHDYMLVDKSRYGLRPHSGGEWLARMEYEHDPNAGIPCAHLHLHAHRDSWTFLMSRNGSGSQRRTVKHRASCKKTPQLSDIHFPLGGPRLRPVLEDLLTLLIQDLGIDHQPDALKILSEARALWRQDQTRAIIASVPELSQDVLTQLGWQVVPAPGYVPGTAQAKWLRQY